MTPPDPALVTAICTGVGTVIGSFIVALRTAKTTQHLKNQIDGPGLEPSMREMIRGHAETSQMQYSELHRDMVLLTQRMENVEKGKGDTIIATTLVAIHDNVRTLNAELGRCRANIHLLANAAQVKLMSQEEAAAKEASLVYPDSGKL